MGHFAVSPKISVLLKNTLHIILIAHGCGIFCILTYCFSAVFLSTVAICCTILYYAGPWAVLKVFRPTLPIHKDEEEEEEEESWPRWLLFVVTGIAVLIMLMVWLIILFVYMRHKKALKTRKHRKEKTKSTHHRRKRTGKAQKTKSKTRTKLNKKVFTALSVIIPPLKPKKMKSAEIDYKGTKQAALVMQAEYKGDVKHELDDEQSEAISHIAFDPNQNSIAYIGTQVEQLVGASQMTIPVNAEEAEAAQGTRDRALTAEGFSKSAEATKAPTAEALKSRSQEEFKGTPIKIKGIGR